MRPSTWGPAKSARRHPVLGLVAVVAATVMANAPLAGAASAAGPANQATPTIRPAALSPGNAPAGATALGAVASSALLDLQIVLPPSNPAALQSTLSALYDPQSPDYHQWLAPGQFDSQFGPSPEAVAAVTAWLHTRGLTAGGLSGFSIQVSAPAGQVAAALGTTFERYRTASGTTGYLARQTPLVPAALAGGDISAILGLNTLSQFHSNSSPVSPGTPASKARGTYQPNADGLTACSAAAEVAFNGYDTLDQVGADYGVGSLLSAGLNGKGQTVAVYELAAHSSSDVTAYESCFGLHNPVSTASVDGGGALSNGTFEADLDIEQVATQAPGASIISYEAPNTAGGAVAAWTAIVQQDKAKVISTSWGECEPQSHSDGSLSAFDTLFEQAAAQGQTVLAATGDSGAEDCYPENNSTSAEVDFPAVGQVGDRGGRHLSLRAGKRVGLERLLRR